MIINKRKYLVIFLIPLLVACSDWMELVPLDGLVKDEYWESKDDVEAVLMGAYQLFAQQDEVLFMYGEIRGDMISAGDLLSTERLAIMEGTISPTNSLCDWENFYTVINYCNLVIKYGAIVQEKDATYSDYEMKGHQAEAIYLRSLAYFYLVRTFKEVPLIVDAIESDADDLFPSKATEEEVLTQIEADLNVARLGITDNYETTEENKGRATKGAINALLADIALWNFDYESCLEYVSRVEECEYELMPTSRWFEIFNPGNSVESIYEFQFDESLDQLSSMYNLTYLDYFLPSESAAEILEPIYIRGVGSMQSQTNVIWKYIGRYADGHSIRSSSDDESVNWIVYRLSDVLLMKAEALSQLNRFDEALSVINEFRTARLLTPLESIDPDAGAFEDIIMNERAIEFAFEGKRWFDLLRMGRRNNFQRKSELIEILVKNVPASKKLILAAKLKDPMGWYLPIEDDELQRNSNLTQNSYYATYTND